MVGLLSGIPQVEGSPAEVTPRGDSRVFSMVSRNWSIKNFQLDHTRAVNVKAAVSVLLQRGLEQSQVSY